MTFSFIIKPVRSHDLSMQIFLKIKWDQLCASSKKKVHEIHYIIISDNYFWCFQCCGARATRLHPTRLSTRVRDAGPSSVLIWSMYSHKWILHEQQISLFYTSETCPWTRQRRLVTRSLSNFESFYLFIQWKLKRKTASYCVLKVEFLSWLWYSSWEKHPPNE